MTFLETIIPNQLDSTKLLKILVQASVDWHLLSLQMCNKVGDLFGLVFYNYNDTSGLLEYNCSLYMHMCKFGNISIVLFCFLQI